MTAEFSARQLPQNRNTGSSSLDREEGGEPPPLAEVRFCGSIDYRELRKQVGMRAVLETLEWTPSAGHGSQLRGPCPIHRSADSHSRSFSVEVEKGMFRCFGCGNKGNQLDLFAAVTNQPLLAAALELCRRLGIEPPKQL